MVFRTNANNLGFGKVTIAGLWEIILWQGAGRLVKGGIAGVCHTGDMDPASGVNYPSGVLAEFGQMDINQRHLKVCTDLVFWREAMVAGDSGNKWHMCSWGQSWCSTICNGWPQISSLFRIWASAPFLIRQNTHCKSSTPNGFARLGYENGSFREIGNRATAWRVMHNPVEKSRLSLWHSQRRLNVFTQDKTNGNIISSGHIIAKHTGFPLEHDRSDKTKDCVDNDKRGGGDR